MMEMHDHGTIKVRMHAFIRMIALAAAAANSVNCGLGGMIDSLMMIRAADDPHC
jgi:hypothetical protein